MIRSVFPGGLAGEVCIPGSKSHTIRALVVGSLASGTSRIIGPLMSEDTRACVSACRAMGAAVEEAGGEWRVHGTAGKIRSPKQTVDVGNSGTTLNLCAGMASLGSRRIVLTGDDQVRRRPVGPLLTALGNLGVEAVSTGGNGCPPLEVTGPMTGGRTRIACPSSQYLSSLLLSCPLAAGETKIEVAELNERPYVEMTLDWLTRQDIVFHRRGYEEFRLPGGQAYRPFVRRIPGDYSSATFFLCAAAVTGSRLAIRGLDPEDTQGDRAVLRILESMGCTIFREGDLLTIDAAGLEGGEFDLNAIPDALPALAVAGCTARGSTALLNVPQARIKETDRIRVMREELSRLGGRIEELPDGLVVHHSRLRGTTVHSRGDHRVAMALAVAGLAAEGETRIHGAEAAAVTFPAFFELLDGIRIPPGSTAAP